LVVPIGDSDALADALTTIIADPQRFQRSRADVEARFSTAKTIDAYEALFHQLTTRK
jgi:glycosyltransferase involved in cell wall biosynthesis